MPDQLTAEIARAVDHLIANCLQPLAGKRVVVIAHDSGPFWSTLAHRIGRAAGRVTAIAEPAGAAPPDRLVPKPLGVGRFFLPQLGEYEAALTILESPLRPAPQSDPMQLREALLALHRSRHPTAFIEWPSWMGEGAAQERLFDLYLSALQIDYDALRRRNREIADRLSQATTLLVTAPNGTEIELERGEAPVLCEDCRIQSADPFFQLPGGEVFFAPREGSARGNIVTRIGSRRVAVTVRNGIADFSGLPGLPAAAPLTEFGVGTNPKAPLLSSLSVGEKARGTCHFGFGDNREFGGSVSAPYHFDLVVENPTIRLRG